MTAAQDPVSIALEKLLAQFGAMVRQVGWRHRLGESDIDEVMQEVRIRIWHAHGQSEQLSALSASYVYRTATTAALDLLRRRRAQRLDRRVPLEEETAAAAASSGPEADVAAGELAAQVAAAIETIPASRRPAVRMYLAGYAREEIAELMGWTEAKTRNLVYRGLADLRERLAERGVGWEGTR